jgi:arabinofuranosyltransferase
LTTEPTGARPSGARLALVLALLGAAFTYVFLQNAWVADDAYITFRTVDNWIGGHGLTWNVHERVQVYTHPLWMMVMTGAVLVTGEYFLTAIALSFVLSTGALALVVRLLLGQGGAAWRCGLLFALVVVSKAVMDYTSSGLENPLSYLLAAVFCTALLGRDTRELSERRLLGLFLVASLAFVNRQDTILLYVPALAVLLVQHARTLRGRLGRVLLIGTAPAVLWLLFSVVYYGFPFPNTAYAKLWSNLSTSGRLERGLDYLQDSLRRDAFSHAVLVLALVLAALRRRRTELLLLAGALLYFAYVVGGAASATHMSGRFFALPLFVGVVAATFLVRTPRSGAVLAGAALLFALWSPFSAVKMGTGFYRSEEAPDEPSTEDLKWAACNAGAGLFSDLPRERLPDHPWLRQGLAFHDDPARVHVGGAAKGFGIGLFGFAAGPEKVVIDFLALSDPLLARLPARRPSLRHSGHYVRMIPEGYVESVVTGENRIVDPDLRVYYDHLLVVTTGPLFSRERFATIWSLNLGRYDHLVASYHERDDRKLSEVLTATIGPVR